MPYIEVDIDLDDHTSIISDEWLISELESRSYKVIYDCDTMELPSKMTMVEKDNIELFMEVFRDINQIELETFLTKFK